MGSDTIASAVFFIDDENGTKTQVSSAHFVFNLQFILSTVSGNVATARFAQGTNNLRYNITVRINNTQGLKYERVVVLTIRNK